MSGFVRTLIPLALAVTVTAGAVPSAQAAPAATSQLQVIGVGVQAGMAHAIRDSAGNWTKFGWLSGYNDFYGTYALDSAIVNGNNDVVFDYLAGSTHTPTTGFLVRQADGSWLNATAPGGGAHAGDELAVANVNHTLTLVRLQDAKFQLATYDGATWSPWQDVPLTGQFRDVALTSKGSTARLVALKGDGSGFVEMDRANGTWGTPTTVPFTSPIGAPGGALRITAVQIGDDLHVVLSDVWRMYHTIQHSNGNWDNFGDLAGVAGFVEQPVDVAAAEVAGELQLVITNGNPDGGDHMFHTIRHADGTWQRFGDVGQVAGETNAGLITVASQ
ncbi:hypothetical protein [Kutzneria sp. CA-103260]|uniref:hypothetical protein n=1 Tax=Kutzneria sp. CA-103260 TaxID=2802641 RepID=UPI001BA7FA0C|nr:hypothetical protein [Kutzneria sp. CA-103260]QUQ69044.1 hypothetical protein JJ691_67980 [Kutzneria sp. CA-103260]